MSNAAQQAATTMQSALTGERIFKDVRFAITGDRHADMIAGLKAIINDVISEEEPTPPVNDDYYHWRNRVATMKNVLLSLKYISDATEISIKELEARAQETRDREERYKMEERWREELLKPKVYTTPNSMDPNTWASTGAPMPDYIKQKFEALDRSADVAKSALLKDFDNLKP